MDAFRDQQQLPSTTRGSRRTWRSARARRRSARGRRLLPINAYLPKARKQEFASPCSVGALLGRLRVGTSLPSEPRKRIRSTGIGLGYSKPEGGRAAGGGFRQASTKNAARRSHARRCGCHEGVSSDSLHHQIATWAMENRSRKRATRRIPFRAPLPGQLGADAFYIVRAYSAFRACLQ